MVTGPLGIDPLHFTFTLLFFLALFVLYLVLPKGYRVEYCDGYPKRYAWSARSRLNRRNGQQRSGQQYAGAAPSYGDGSLATANTTTPMSRANSNPSHKSLAAQGIRMDERMISSTSGAARRVRNAHYETKEEVTVSFSENEPTASAISRTSPNMNSNNPQQEEIVISAAMQQLRDPGVLIIAHGSKGKPKTVRLQLTKTAITWRTETKKKGSVESSKVPPKLGKLHQVPLSHIMYVDVGKQTTALRRVENAHVPEELCFSLLTKEGSLDLESNGARERDALVACFSLVLDEVHAANWRDIYRGPSSDMPSSFDDFDNTSHVVKGGNNVD